MDRYRRNLRFPGFGDLLKQSELSSSRTQPRLLKELQWREGSQSKVVLKKPKRRERDRTVESKLSPLHRSCLRAKDLRALQYVTLQRRPAFCPDLSTITFHRRKIFFSPSTRRASRQCGERWKLLLRISRTRCNGSQKRSLPILMYSLTPSKPPQSFRLRNTTRFLDSQHWFPKATSTTNPFPHAPPLSP